MTSLSPRRFHLALGALFVAVLGLAIFLARVAHAQTAPDPVASAAGASDVLISILITYGPVWGGMAIVFGVASAALERNESTHWIAQGRTLAGITAVVGLGIAALEAHFGRAPWAGVVLTVIVGAFKLIDPTVTVKQASSSSAAGAALTLLLIFVVGGVTLVPACQAPQHAGHAVIDCAGGTTPGIVTSILETLNDWNCNLADGGCRVPAGPGSGASAEATYDWSCIEASAVAKGLQVGGCALAELVESYLAPPARRAAARAAQSVLARATLEGYRRDHAGGATFRTAHGDL